MEKQNIHIMTLGCSKNLVDSEFLMTQLESNGFNVTHDNKNIQDGILLINTCGFIHDAKEESVNAIMEAVDYKVNNVLDKVVVFGCLSERYKKDLQSEIPEVDAFFGVNDWKEIIEYLGGTYSEELKYERNTTTPAHYAYLKISEGCNWGCSYCAIPLIRGKHISKSIEDLVFEAKVLAKKGVKELILIAQDLTYYGLDIYKQRRLGDLLLELEKVEGIEWIRLHYAYPTKFPMDVIQIMKQSTKICKYIDIPLQHINTKILTNMRRGIDADKTKELILNFRSEIPEIAIRTTFLVGHPGETDEDFAELLDFVEEFKFERLGAFAYSEEEDTYGAAQFSDDIPEEVKEKRIEELMILQEQISNNLNSQKVGNTYKVIIDRIEGDFFIGRTEFDSPDVDNEVIISADEELDVGSFYQVKVNSAESYDLYAELVK